MRHPPRESERSHKLVIHVQREKVSGKPGKLDHVTIGDDDSIRLER